MSHSPPARRWDTRRSDKRDRLTRAAHYADGKVVPTTNIVSLLESLLVPGDRVVL